MTRPSTASQSLRQAGISETWMIPAASWSRSLPMRLLGFSEVSEFGITADLALLSLATLAATLGAGRAHVALRDWWLALPYPLIVVTLARFRRPPTQRLDRSAIDTAGDVLRSVSLAAMLTLAVQEILVGGRPLGLALRLWLFAFVYLGAGRAALLSLRSHMLSSGSLARPTLIVGSATIASQIADQLYGRPEHGLRPIGSVDIDLCNAGGSGGSGRLAALRALDEIAGAVERTGARHVVLPATSQRDHATVIFLRRCQQLGFDVSPVPRLLEQVAPDRCEGIPLLTLGTIDPKGWQFAAKHAFDRVLAMVFLVVGSPILLLIAAAVRLSSPGPVLFRQSRIGRDGNAFEMYKFRTMVAAYHDQRFLPPEGMAPGGVEGVDRRTGVGRWLRRTSLDELPQLVNVLRGDMSLVGPRPERPEFVELFTRDVFGYEQRHRVKSGITGWAQVNGLRGCTSIADRVKWDNYYIRNWSLTFDLRILAMTVADVLRGRGLVTEQPSPTDDPHLRPGPHAG